MTSEAQPITVLPQHTITLANQIAAADGATPHDIHQMSKDAWSSLTRIARGILKAFAEVGIAPTEVYNLTDDQLHEIVGCAEVFGTDNDEQALDGGRYAVEAFLEGELDCEV